MVDKKTVQKVADLARLKVSDDQVETIEAHLNKILNYFKKLQDVPTEGIEPLVVPHDLLSCLREDKVEKDLNIDELLENAPDIQGQLFRVPPVV